VLILLLINYYLLFRGLLMATRRKFIRTSILSAAGFTIVPRSVLGRGFIAPSDQITIGFIGTGKQSHGPLGKNFLNRQACRIVAACDVDSAKLKAFKEFVETSYTQKYKESGTPYKGCTTYRDVRELINNKEIDAVVIVTPDHWHAIPTILAAEAGKDIYCEKPLSLTISEGRAMVDAVRAHKRVFQTGSMQRSMETFHVAAQLVRNGYIGDIKRIVVSVGGPPTACAQEPKPVPKELDWDMWLGPAPETPYSPVFAPPFEELKGSGSPGWRFCEKFGGGRMADWGAHMFDIAQWVLDMDKSGPVEVHPPDDKQYKVLTYRYKNGIPMVRDDFGKGNAVRFEGSEGTIDVSRKTLDLPEKLKGKELGPKDKKLYYSRDHYMDWLNAIKNRSVPICDVETGHRTATVCQIGNIAYKLGRPLKWNPEQERFEKDDEANRMRKREMREPWKKLMAKHQPL
jgi:predicted dehydrogenase